MMMLSETHVTPDFNDSELKIDGYQLIRCDSNSRHTGGVAIYVKDNCNYSVVHSEHKSKTWILTIKISENITDGNFTVIYKSPKEKINDFLSIFDEFCEKTIDNNNKSVIVGDMNIDLSKNTKNGKKYLKEIESHNLQQIVNDFTRVHKTSKTIIDHIVTNSQEVSYVINKEEAFSDHFLIEINCNQIRKEAKLPKKKTTKKMLEKLFQRKSERSAEPN